MSHKDQHDDIQISLATADGFQEGRVARLGDDDLSFIVDGPVRGKRTQVFQLKSPRSSQPIWGTLRIVGEAAAPYGRRVRAHIQSINIEHVQRLQRWAEGEDEEALVEVVVEDPEEDDTITETVTTPGRAHTDSRSATNVLGSDCFAPLTDLTPANEAGMPMPTTGRMAIRAAMRRSLNQVHPSRAERGHRLRLAAGHSRRVISHDMAPVSDEVLRAEWDD